MGRRRAIAQGDKMSLLLDFAIGVVIGIFGGGVIITLLAIIIATISENTYYQKMQEAIRMHNRYIDKKYNEFIKLNKEFLKLKRKMKVHF